MAIDEVAKRELVAVARPLLIGLAVVVAAGVLAKTFLEAVRIRHNEQRITVTGSATRRIRSDMIVWEATVRTQDPALTAAYKKLAGDVPQVVEYLKGKGIKEGDITVHSTLVTQVHPRDEQGQDRQETVLAYITEQKVRVKSADIPTVEKVSREATELIDRGILIHSDAPLYTYTKLSELKIRMLAEASKDAKLRAEQIALNTGANLGGLLNARMGVLQVNPEFSTAVSWEGNNDKTTLNKDVLAIVTASFALR
jgi:hypothetical protein